MNTTLTSFDQAIQRLTTHAALPSVPARRVIFEALIHLEAADALLLPSDPEDVRQHVRIALEMIRMIREASI